jgi:hypothetical protein
MPPNPSRPSAAAASRGRRRVNSGLAVVLALFAAWSAWFVLRTSFVVDGVRTFSLFDDAMISMTYARNLVEGHGLNWAPTGAPVEGFSNPLWTFAMVPVNALPVAREHRALLVQALAFLLLVANVVLVRRLVARHFSCGRGSTAPTAGLPAALLTAFYYPLDYWGLMGMETALQALLATAAVLLALDLACDGRPRHGLLFAVLAAAYLTRMDMTLLIVAVLAFVGLHGGFRAAERRSWLLGAAGLVLTVAGYQLFRWLYFHDALPNPYYLKMTGIPWLPRLLRGVSTLTDSLRANSLALAALAVGVLPRLRARPRWRLPALLVALYAAYGVYVGGDAWEGRAEGRVSRFVVFLAPLVFALFNAVLNEWSRYFAALRPRLRAAATVAATATLLFLVDGLWLSDQAAANWKAVTVTEAPLLVTSNQIVFRDLRDFQRQVRPRALVATCWAGIPAYFSDFRMIDLYGVNDRRVARESSAVALRPGNFIKYVPGHVKWDADYVLGERRPDALFQSWVFPDAVLKAHGYEPRGKFWVRAGSPRVRRHPRAAGGS